MDKATDKVKAGADMDVKELLAIAVQAMADKKAQQIVSMQLTGLSTMTDYFLICSGNNAPQIKAICDYVDDKLGEVGVNPQHMEGYQDAHWVLMDYGDFIIHIFAEEERGYYSLERLWSDCPTIAYEEAEQR